MGVYMWGCADSWVTGYSTPYPLKIRRITVTRRISYRALRHGSGYMPTHRADRIVNKTLNPFILKHIIHPNKHPTTTHKRIVNKSSPRLIIKRIQNK